MMVQSHMQAKQIALALVCALPAVAQTPAQMIAAVESRQVPNHQGMDPLTMKEMMERLHVPGVSVAVIQDFKIHWAKSWGVVDVETQEPVTNDTMFQAASISKPVAAMTSLRAIQEGKFGLDQDVNTILEELETTRQPVCRRWPGHAPAADEPQFRHRRRFRVPPAIPRRRLAAANRKTDSGWRSADHRWDKAAGALALTETQYSGEQR